jgi:hypothetical protein
MLRRLVLVIIDVSEELIASITRMTRIGELGTNVARFGCLFIPSSPIATLMMEAIHSSETSVLTRATLRNIPEDDILHSHRRENLESYIALTGWTLVET